MSERPTEPGPYWYRAKEGNEWVILNLCHRDGVPWVRSYEPNKEGWLHSISTGAPSFGQWVKIEEPGECVWEWTIDAWDTACGEISFSQPKRYCPHCGRKAKEGGE